MSKLNVTKGEWIISEKSSNGIVAKNDALAIVQEGFDEYDIVAVWKDADNNHNDNAIIICDAANTYNKTGFTPSELAQQVEEMREALEMLYNAFPNDSKGVDILFGVHQLLTKYPKK